MTSLVTSTAAVALPQELHKKKFTTHIRKKYPYSLVVSEVGEYQARGNTDRMPWNVNYLKLLTITHHQHITVNNTGAIGFRHHDVCV